MFIAPFLQKAVTTLLAGGFLYLGFATFGNAYLFDRIFFGLILGLAIFFYKDKNLLGILLIILLGRALEEVTFPIMPNAWAKIGIYLGSAIWLYRLTQDRLKPYCVAALCLCIGAEAYWWLIDYSSPQIHWPMAMICFNSLVRHLITQRMLLTEKWFPGQMQPLVLDDIVYKLAALHIVIWLASLAEYLVRHLLGLTQIVYIYYALPYALQALAMLLLFFLSDQSIKLAKIRLFKA